MNRFILLALTLILSCCSDRDTPIKKQHNDRDNIFDITTRIVPINVENLLLSSVIPKVLNDKLIILDYRSYSDIIHIFDKNSFQHLYSGVNKGRGKNEIISPGGLAVDKQSNGFFITDHGKRRIYKYNIDSLISLPNYSPSLKTELNKSIFPDEYKYINDTTCYGVFVEPIGNNDFSQVYAAWNMKSGEVYNRLEYSPNDDKKRICGTVDTKLDIIVEAYIRNDIIVISGINGNPKYVVYGPQTNSSEKSYKFTNVIIYKDFIIASYSGKPYQDEGSFAPNNLHVFSLDGDYIKTLKTNYNMLTFCLDKDSDRLIISFDDDDIQLGYIDLNSIILHE